MAWTWRFEKSDGTETEPALQPDEFTTQGDAESWIGEFWKELVEGGAEQVTLFEDTTKIYGPMSLRADQPEQAEQADQAGQAEADRAGAADTA
ncbi:hypothetical protein AB0L68_37790 [Streptomyces sp. NPDC052164]|uniref:hypothetical protein n=1 Tax=Streptomyces sp. NPDC052164 TaxID=3155529 RepID=UPI003413A630